MIKQFSTYKINLNSSVSERDAALEYAKKLRESNLKKLKDSKEYQDKQKEKEAMLQKIKELEEKKKLDRKKELEKVQNLSNEQIQKNIEKAKENNEKLKGKFNPESKIEDVLDSIFE